MDNISTGNITASGNISASGYISASKFVGDGSELSGVTSYTDTDTLAYINSQNVLSGSNISINNISASGTIIGNVLELGDGSQGSPSLLEVVPVFVPTFVLSL